AVAERAQPLPERRQRVFLIALAEAAEVREPEGLRRPLRVCPGRDDAGGGQRGEEAEEDLGHAGSASAHHAATAVCWLSTVAIFRPPSILRNRICPLATRLKSKPIGSSPGREPCVFTRRRNSSWSRSSDVWATQGLSTAMWGRRRTCEPPHRLAADSPPRPGSAWPTCPRR